MNGRRRPPPAGERPEEGLLAGDRPEEGLPGRGPAGEGLLRPLTGRDPTQFLPGPRPVPTRSPASSYPVPASNLAGGVTGEKYCPGLEIGPFRHCEPPLDPQLPKQVFPPHGVLSPGHGKPSHGPWRLRGGRG